MGVIYEPKGKAREYSPLAINIFEGCEHRCEYCYVPLMPGKYRTFLQQGTPKKDIEKRVYREASKLDPETTPPILLCFTSDPYQPSDVTVGVTRKVIQALKSYGLRVQILTKGGTRACRDFDLLTDRDYYAATLTFTDRKQSKLVEPEAALPKNRLESLKRAKRAGINTWVSIEPVIDPAQSLDLIRMTGEYVDFYKVGKLNHKKNDTEWTQFAHDAVALLEEMDKPYYIKKDLAVYLDDETRTKTARRNTQEARPPQEAVGLF